MANREPLIVKKLLLMPLILGIVYKKVIIEDFCILSRVIYKKNPINIVLYIVS